MRITVIWEHRNQWRIGTLVYGPRDLYPYSTGQQEIWERWGRTNGREDGQHWYLYPEEYREVDVSYTGTNT